MTVRPEEDIGGIEALACDRARFVFRSWGSS